MRLRSALPRATVWVLLAAFTVALSVTLFVVLREAFLRDGQFTISVLTKALTAAGVVDVLRNSIIIVAISAVLATMVGTLLALVATKLNVRWPRLLRAVPLVPLTIAPLVGAIGWVFLLAPRTGWINILIRKFTGGEEGPLNIFSLPGAVWVTTLYVIPYVFASMSTALERTNPETLEAFLVNGTGRMEAVRRLVTGVLRPALVAGFILAALESAVQFSIPLILDVHVLTTTIYQYIQHAFPARRDLAAALAMLLLVFGVGLTLAEIAVLGRRRFTSLGGRGLSARRWTFGRRADHALEWLAVGYLLVSTVLPVGAIVLVSFQPFWKPEVRLGDLTVRHYGEMLNSSNFLSGLGNSLRLAVIGALVVVVLSLAISLLRNRVGGRTGQALYMVANLPLGIPGIVFGLGLLIVFTGPVALYGTLGALAAAYVLHFLPMGLRNIDPVVRQVGQELEEAATVSGAGRGRVLKDVTLPMVFPGVSAAAAITAILILREFPMSSLLATPTTKVASVYIVDTFENGVFPQVAVMAIVLSVVSLIGVAALQYANSRIRFSSRSRSPRIGPGGGAQATAPPLAAKRSPAEAGARSEP